MMIMTMMMMMMTMMMMMMMMIMTMMILLQNEIRSRTNYWRSEVIIMIISRIYEGG